jgi:hypothetical protein
MIMFKKLIQHLLILVIVVSPAACSDSGNQQSTSASDVATPRISQSDANLCPLGDAVEVDGVRRLALIVGVGEYRDDEIPDLLGPPNDAKQVYDLLTGDNSFQFPRQNVCLLLNERADKAAFKEAFERGLITRARENDLAVIYFAGHGSQTRDLNQDEPDNRDETLMLHDASSTDSSRDLIDDELHLMLSKLDSKTRNITLILDSCNSGSAQRNADAGTYTARFFNRVLNTQAPTASEPGMSSGDAGAEMASKDLPGLIAVTAARDGTAALELGGHGLFTDALVGALATGSNEPLTWAQLARMVPLEVASESNQIPSFQGDLERHVFGIDHGLRPLGWEVVKVGERLTLGGPPLPGYTKGSELRIYAGNAKGIDLRDPGKAKATVILEQTTGLTASARVTSAAAGSPAPQPGDIAILARPGDEYTRITVRLRPAAEAGGIPAERAASIRTSIENHPEASMLTQLTQGPGDFELSVGEQDRILLRGPENTIRVSYENDSAIAKNLWQHARQRALLHLKGEGGADFTDNHSLQVQLIPSEKQDVCADGNWVQAPPNEEQIIPLCHKFNIQVSLQEDTNLGMLDHNTPAGVQVGGVILSTDGSILGFPIDGRSVRIAPGETAKFDLQGETFRGIPPLDVQDRIIVFGTRETNPVQWHRLTETAKTRSKGIASQNALFRALHNYLQPGSRGIEQTVATDESSVESDTWTLTSLTTRVEANSRFLKATAGKPTNKREYTINNFDIRPYLPDDRSTALYKVLRVADRLTRRSSGRDGYPYKQHDWSLPTDEANLDKGIDCSRAIWFAFTRAGVPYNSDKRYLSTAMMTGNDSLMSEEFERCDNSAHFQIGDILVYRDEEREKPDGHVVMVIDPGKRIAWGSHGWDGNEGDRGVEYQLIKIKQDWERWDRKTMYRKACWRHRQFSAQAGTTRGLPGISALSSACSPEKQCGLIP